MWIAVVANMGSLLQKKQKGYLMLRTIIILAAICILTGCSQDEEGEQTKAAEETKRAESLNYFINHSSGASWQTDVFVNGIPALLSGRGGGTSPIANFLVNGENVLEVKAEQREWPSPEPLRVSVLRMESDLQKVAEILVDIAVEPTKVGAQITRKAKFKVTKPFRWVWETAPAVGKLSEDDKKQMLAEIETVYQAFVKKDLALYDQATSVTISEIAKAEGISEAEVKKKQHAYFRKVFADPSYKVELRKTEDVRFKVCGRVVYVYAPGKDEFKRDWWVIRINHSVEGKVERAITFKKFLFCKVNGRWRIIS